MDLRRKFLGAGACDLLFSSRSGEDVSLNVVLELELFHSKCYEDLMCSEDAPGALESSSKRTKGACYPGWLKDTGR
jgi:hypothetical protein